MSTDKKSDLTQYNIDGKNLEAFLGPLESTIMTAIWDSKTRPITVRDVHESLQNTKKIAYTTVMSTMNRLYEKGLLDRRVEKGKGGLYYVYWPVLEEQAFKKSAVGEVLSSLLDNFSEVVANYLTDKSSSSEEVSKALRKMLEKTSKDDSV
ncbi:MAG: BlaI/MecI/CopY family transcriptional regulator [Candidatus Bathyarchaeia archaeon]|jgi:predicted transcriptional regulator